MRCFAAFARSPAGARVAPIACKEKSTRRGNCMHVSVTKVALPASRPVSQSGPPRDTDRSVRRSVRARLDAPSEPAHDTADDAVHPASRNASNAPTTTEAPGGPTDLEATPLEERPGTRVLGRAARLHERRDEGHQWWSALTDHAAPQPSI